MDTQQENWLTRRIHLAKPYQVRAYSAVNELILLKRDKRVITVEQYGQLIDFVSCSYLGLDHHPDVIHATTDALNQLGVTFPCARTRIRAHTFRTLEGLLNKILANSYTTVFGSLHLGHLGVLPLLGTGEMPSFQLNASGPCFIMDKTVHASMQIHRAFMNQLGEVQTCSMHDFALLRSFAKEAYRKSQTPIFIADSIGSMGGIAPIDELFRLAEKYNGYVYLDDAHGMSVFGQRGSGYVLDALNDQFHPRLILSTSLAKGFGAIAGVIAVPTKADEQVIKQFATTYVFGGPPALAIINAAIASAKLHLTPLINALQTQLQDNLVYLDQQLCSIKERIVNYQTKVPIRGLRVGDEYKDIEYTKLLRDKGFAVTAAMYPTVARGQSMLRMAISAEHTHEQLEKIAKVLISL